MAEDLTEPVYWRGQQWAATGYGIEGLADYDYYHIGAHQLKYLGPDGLSEWPAHMAEKWPVNQPDFNRALLEAVRAHKVELPAAAMAHLEALVSMKPANENFAP